MGRRLLLLVVLLVGACGLPQKNQQVQNDMSQKLEGESLSREIDVNETTIINAKKQNEELQSELPTKELSLIDIIQQEGIPTENFWPKSKELCLLFQREQSR
jgi:hypothetical protein